MKKLLLLLIFPLGVFAQQITQQAQQQRVRVTESNYPAAQRFTVAKLQQMSYSGPVSPQWLERSNRFWYSYRTSEGTKFWLVDAGEGGKKPLFDNEYMAAEISRVTKDPYDAQNLPVNNNNIKFTADERAFRFTVTSRFEEVENPETKKKEKKKFTFEYDLKSGKLSVLEDYKTKTLPSWGNVSPDGKRVLYSKDYDLWMMSREDFDKLIDNPKDTTIVETQLTFDGVRGFGFGSATYNSNDKADTTKRGSVTVSWSPDSRHFAYTIADMRDVEPLWVIHNTAGPRPALETYPYHMPGEKGAPKYFMYLFDLETKERHYVPTELWKDQIVGILNSPDPVRERHDDYTIQSKVWMGSEGEFMFRRLSRDSRRLDICRVDVKTREVETLIEERSNFYLEDPDVRLTGGAGSDIIFWSEEDGWAHLYLYNKDGKRIRQITKGAWHVDEIVDVDSRAGVIYFVGNGREKGVNPYYNFLYRVRFDGSGLELLTPGDYSHNVVMDEGARFFVENLTRVDDVPYSIVRTTGGRKVVDIERQDLSGLFAAGYKFPTRFKVKSADGVTDLYGNIYFPNNLDSTKLYPVIEYVYPGPQQEGVTHNFHLPAVALDRLAQLGFVVVTVGNRGGDPHRSRWYHTYGSGDLRDYGLADKKAAAIQLADRYPFMDLERVGITGHSGGGFMSTAAILTYPDFFKVAVSAAGNHNNAIYNRGWGERHQGVKEEVDAKGDTTFKFTVENNEQLVRNLKGRLLLVTGDVDNNVHPANTIRVVDALIKSGKRFDLMVLPGQAHQFGPMNEYYFWRIADYFTYHLMGDKRDRPVDIAELRE